MATPSPTPSRGDGCVLVEWYFDTRKWYPTATLPRHLEAHAARAFAILPPDVRDRVLAYYHMSDAKMALGSALIKHYAIARLARDPAVTWGEVVTTGFTRDGKTKPTFVVAGKGKNGVGRQPVVFNVSHQAGIVALVAVAGYPPPSLPCQVGVDVVSTSERRDRDRAKIMGQPRGWYDFVNTYGDAFSANEVAFLKNEVLSAVPWLLHMTPGCNGAAPTAEQVADGKLRAFYAAWAMREAYVKLTGDALSAPWLKDLEFVRVAPPRPTAGWDVPAKEEEEAGEVVRNIEIRLKGRRVDDVNMCLRSLGDDCMIATAVRTPWNKQDALGWVLGPYEELILEDVLKFAEEDS
ncbi:uncharacterized protein C8A04DRAFT_11016 [Dichotomopilus funicola]|uniref:holo-[acyl-carrier-protein] synthase n=1 Tax=Dichotomopilus funicola TaxID=1934379 RepID=A0AAN6ZMR3_9PEZI|nr:hypothetical protein C8A04DRAFT_11016 [Dichotomopilus funicola]